MLGNPRIFLVLAVLIRPMVRDVFLMRVGIVPIVRNSDCFVLTVGVNFLILHIRVGRSRKIASVSD